MKKLFKAVFVIAFFSILTRILGFLFRIFLSRVVGAEGLGVYQISLSVYLVFETFVCGGLPVVISKFTAKFNTQKNDKLKFSTVCAGLIVGIACALAVCMLLLIFKNIFSLIFTDKRCLTILLTLLPCLVFSCVYAVLRGYLWGEKKYFLVSFTEFLEQLIKVIICVLLAGIINTALDGAVMAGVSLALSCLISSTIVLLIFFRVGGKFKNPKGQFKSIVKSAAPITGVRVISSLVMPIIAIIIPLALVAVGYTTEQALSEYGIAIGMTFPLLYLPSTLVGSLAMTLIPDISSELVTLNYKGIKERIDSSLKFSVFISFLLMPLYLGLGTPIGFFLFDNATAGYYLTYATWIMVPIGVNGIASSSLNALGLEVKSFVNYAIGSVFLVLSIVILPKYIGILALVWGMGLCMTTASVLNIIMIQKRLGASFDIVKNIFVMFLFTLPSALLSHWLFGCISNFLPMFFSIAFAGGIGALCFVSLCVVFGAINLSSLFISFKKNKYKKTKLLHN